MLLQLALKASFLLLLIICGLGAPTFAYASIASFGEPVCGWSSNSEATETIIDITHSYREGLPLWDSSKGLGKVVTQVDSIANGSLANVSEMKMVVHTGTHVDAPSHFLQDAYLAGVDTTKALDLGILNGPVLVVEAPRVSNITTNVIKELIPAGVKRVLFRTLNTDRRLMWKPEFVTDYTALTKEAAEWIADKTSIRLVGVDYLSVGVYDAPDGTHEPLLRKGVILVEGLNLDNVHPGLYVLHCLPARLVGSDGAPTRCILMTQHEILQQSGAF